MKRKNIKLFILAFVLMAVIIAVGFYAYRQFYASKKTLPLETETQMMELLKEDENFLEAPEKNKPTSSPIKEEEDFLPEGFLNN